LAIPYENHSAMRPLAVCGQLNSPALPCSIRTW
jgi:hypothetical protein